MATIATSLAFGNLKPQHPHLMVPSQDPAYDLMLMTAQAFQNLENKGVGYPMVAKVAGGSIVSATAVGSGPVAAAVTGSGFLQGQTKASAVIAGTSTGKLTLTANRPGTPGNLLSMDIVDSGSSHIAVTIVGSNIHVNLGGDTKTMAQLKTAVDAVAGALVQTAASGTGNAKVTAQTALAGGVGAGVQVLLAGVDQQVTGAVTDTAIPMSINNISSASAGDMLGFQVVSNGICSDMLPATIIT
jgi:hypothetical protein